MRSIAARASSVPYHYASYQRPACLLCVAPILRHEKRSATAQRCVFRAYEREIMGALLLAASASPLRPQVAELVRRTGCGLLLDSALNRPRCSSSSGCGPPIDMQTPWSEAG